ncbi:MAG: sugar transferase [Methylocella sp.]
MASDASSRSAITVSLVGEQAPVGGAVKRLLDICLAATGILLLMPLMLLCALAIYISSRQAILYRHRRVGFRGETFNCLKFRTMASDGEAILRAHFTRHPEARAEWEATRKLRADPRVTAFGRVLRKTSVDELPQLFNVLKGEMSIVGPRPIVEQELARYGGRRDAYLACRPGITGLWQTRGRSKASYSKRVACDSCYAKNWSLVLDLRIIVRTLPVLLGSDSAY